jgi:hypothetical protein
MDAGQFRPPRPMGRRVVSRPEPAQRQPEDVPQPVAKVDRPKTVHRAVAAPQHSVAQNPGLFQRLKIPLIIAVVIVLLGITGFATWTKLGSAGLAVDSSKYQAVFFTNGQVYFGKLHAFNSDYMKLTDIYYLQTQAPEQENPENPQQTATDQNNVQLIKLGDEIHGPQDEMIISKAQVLFYENLKSDSKVAQSIDQHKNSN